MVNLGSESLLLLVAQVAGVVLLVCTMLLIGFRRIYFDAETKQPIEIELPVLGKIRTQAPAIVLVAIAAFLVVYPLTRSRPDMATVIGDVETGGKAVTVRVLAVPQFQTTLQRSGRYHLPVPLLKDNLYRVEYIVDSTIIADQEVELVNNEFHPTFVGYQPPPGQAPPETITRKEVSDDVLQKAGIPVSH